MGRRINIYLNDDVANGLEKLKNSGRSLNLSDICAASIKKEIAKMESRNQMSESVYNIDEPTLERLRRERDALEQQDYKQGFDYGFEGAQNSEYALLLESIADAERALKNRELCTQLIEKVLSEGYESVEEAKVDLGFGDLTTFGTGYFDGVLHFWSLLKNQI